MSTWIIVPVLLVVFFVVLLLFRRRYQGSGTEITTPDQPVSREGRAVLSMNEAGTIPEKEWWRRASSLQQLQLALYLAEKAMPVWEKFTSSQVVSYREASAGPFIIIESDLLQRTLEYLFVHVQQHFPKDDLTKIHQYHNRFIGPVLALKDGTWVCNYPVKKIFLSVYFVLMSVVEQHDASTNENSVSEAITAALECMELSKLYTPEEIESLLEAYNAGLYR